MGLRVALTYRENDTTVNPYWDGTELKIVWAGENIRLLEELALIDEHLIIKGSLNALAATAKYIDEATRVEEQSAHDNSEDPFTDFFSK
ncbi:hypothetical protein D3C73_1199700 [compost metagenome]